MTPVAGLGTDLARVERFRKFLDDPKKAVLERIFTSGEQAYALAKADPAPFLAARFAAKEAFLKSLGLGLSKGMAWREIEVVKDEAGKPMLGLHGTSAQVFADLGGGSLHLSMSHDGDYALATVIWERSS